MTNPKPVTLLQLVERLDRAHSAWKQASPDSTREKLTFHYDAQAEWPRLSAAIREMCTALERTVKAGVYTNSKGEIIWTKATAKHAHELLARLDQEKIS